MRSTAVVNAKIASIAFSESFASRPAASPAIASGSISKIGSIPTQIADPFFSIASTSRSPNKSDMNDLSTVAKSLVNKPHLPHIQNQSRRAIHRPIPRRPIDEERLAQQEPPWHAPRCRMEIFILQVDRIRPKPPVKTEW